MVGEGLMCLERKFKCYTKDSEKPLNNFKLRVHDLICMLEDLSRDSVEDSLRRRALVQKRSVGKLLHYFTHEILRLQSKTATIGMDRKP